MKQVISKYISIFVILTLFLTLATPILAQDYYPIPAPTGVTPEPCFSGQGGVPPAQRTASYCPDLSKADPNAKHDPANYKCAGTYDEWLANKELNFWVHDPEITALGKGGERSRQFLLWVLTHPSIDDHPVILEIWSLSRNVATFLILIVAIIMGVGIIIGSRRNFDVKVEISPLIIRLAILLLFVVFSARIVLILIQLSDIMMEFFIKQLGVRELFNIFFVQGKDGTIIKESESAYREFVGCTNWNISNVEMVRTSKFLVKFTNMTYYFVGIMLILRKVVLWFLLVISPFLAILAPFTLIRNTGWIWIGVFFQWIFYGPIFALFLGTLAKIWNSPPVHIPFANVDYSRVHQMAEAVYPTSINILYGGPAQTLGIWNTSNYVDTFAEYVIALIMLWTVVILPWWLLRIFRDYCCDGIIASKNILLSMYDTMRNPPPPPPGDRPGGAPNDRTRGQEMKLPDSVKTQVEQKIEIKTVQEIKAANTADIMRSVNLSASRLTDIATMETRGRETVRQNMDYLQNPMKATTASDRARFMTVRNEILSRASRQDAQAKQATSAVVTSSQEKMAAQSRMLASIPKMVPVISTVSVKFNMSVEKTRAIMSRILQTIRVDTPAVAQIAQMSGVTPPQVSSILSTMQRAEVLDRPSMELVTQTAKETGVAENQVKAVIAQTAVVIRQKREVTKDIAVQEGVEEQVVEKLAAVHLPAVSAPEKHVEDNIAPAKVSLEEYEEVKAMWAEQYEKGEVPVSENITDRKAWVEQDAVSITNILNKLMSVDSHVAAKGLEEVGYILPIFMVNGMSGEQLVTYLRAKLEAAKQVSTQIAREEAIRAEAPEEFVDIERQKTAEKPKEAVLEESLEMEEPEIGGQKTEVGNQESEDRGQKTEVGSQMTGDGGQDIESQTPEDTLKQKLEDKSNGN